MTKKHHCPRRPFASLNYVNHIEFKVLVSLRQQVSINWVYIFTSKSCKNINVHLWLNGCVALLNWSKIVGGYFAKNNNNKFARGVMRGARVPLGVVRKK